jgi:dihydropteroate synthase
MHMQGLPATMQHAPHYVDVVAEVSAFLTTRTQALIDAGVARDRVVVDPGFGFGKTVDHSLTLLRALDEIASLGWPVLVGLSRKGLIGALTGRPVDERLAGSVAAALIAVDHGAAIVRVHDVAPTIDALKILYATQEIGEPADNRGSRGR